MKCDRRTRCSRTRENRRVRHSKVIGDLCTSLVSRLLCCARALARPPFVLVLAMARMAMNRPIRMAVNRPIRPLTYKSGLLPINLHNPIASGALLHVSALSTAARTPLAECGVFPGKSSHLSRERILKNTAITYEGYLQRVRRSCYDSIHCVIAASIRSMRSGSLDRSMMPNLLK